MQLLQIGRVDTTYNSIVLFNLARQGAANPGVIKMKMFKARLLDKNGFVSKGCVYAFAKDSEEASEIVAKRILSGFIVEEVVIPSSAEIYAVYGDEK